MPKESESVIELTGKITNVYQKRTTYYDMLTFDGVSSVIRSSLHVDLFNENGEMMDQNNFATGLNGEWSEMRATGHLHKIPHQNLTLVLKTRDQTQTLDKFIFSWHGFPEDKPNLVPEPTSESTITQINIAPKQGYAGDDIVFEALVSEPDTTVHLDIFDEHGARKLNTGQVVFDKPFKHVLTLSKSIFKPGTLIAEFYTDNSNEKKAGSFRFLGSPSKSKDKPISNSSSVIPTNQKLESKPESLTDNNQWDFFICHASENKDEVAKPLSDSLTQTGLKIWYDEGSLSWGDSLMQSINHGLKNSSFGVVIFSKEFFEKNWPQRELEGLFNLTKPGQKKILPLRYKLSQQEINEKYPILSGILSRSWDDGLDKLVEEAKQLVEAKQKQSGEKTDNSNIRKSDIENINQQDISKSPNRIIEVDENIMNSLKNISKDAKDGEIIFLKGKSSSLSVTLQSNDYLELNGDFTFDNTTDMIQLLRTSGKWKEIPSNSV